MRSRVRDAGEEGLTPGADPGRREERRILRHEARPPRRPRRRPPGPLRCLERRGAARARARRAARENLQGFDERERKAFDRLSDEIHVLAAEREFWEADGGAVARDTCARYAALLSSGGRIVEAPECHAALRGVLLSLAFLVANKPALRRFAGIRKRFFRW